MIGLVLIHLFFGLFLQEGPGGGFVLPARPFPDDFNGVEDAILGGDFPFEDSLQHHHNLLIYSDTAVVLDVFVLVPDMVFDFLQVLFQAIAA